MPNRKNAAKKIQARKRPFPATLLTVSLLPSPRFFESIALSPTPVPTPMAIIKICTGKAAESADRSEYGMEHSFGARFSCAGVGETGRFVFFVIFLLQAVDNEGGGYYILYCEGKSQNRGAHVIKTLARAARHAPRPLPHAARHAGRRCSLPAERARFGTGTAQAGFRRDRHGNQDTRY